MGIKSFLTLPFARFIVFLNNRWKKNALIFQEKIMLDLLLKAEKTVFGKDHFFSKIKTYADFKKNVPLRDYEGIKM